MPILRPRVYAKILRPFRFAQFQFMQFLKTWLIIALLCFGACVPLDDKKSKVDSEGFAGRIDSTKFDYYNSRGEDGKIQKVIAYHRDLKQFFEADTAHKVFDGIPGGQVKFLDAKQFTAARLVTNQPSTKNSGGESTDDRKTVAGPAIALYIIDRMEETLPELPAPGPTTQPPGGGSSLPSLEKAYTVVVCTTNVAAAETIAISYKGDRYYASYLNSTDRYFEVTRKTEGTYASASGHFVLEIEPRAQGLSSRGTLYGSSYDVSVSCYWQG